MKPLKLTRAFLLMALLVLSVALVSCVPEGDDEDDEEGSRAPVVRQLV
jgi:hypothetical protein